MKKLFLFLLIFFAVKTYAQKRLFDEPQWKIKLYFEDATGAKDTLTIGYDPTAGPYTETIDPQFDEDWEQIDTTLFNVYLQQYRESGSTTPYWPPINTDMVRKKSITSWPYPQDIFAWMHGEVPITMTWDEPQLDSSDLPSPFIDLEPYPRARIDIWVDAWAECIFPDCIEDCPITDPFTPIVILTGYTDFNWGLAPCALPQPLIWDTDNGNEIDENVISVPSLLVTPFLEIFWMGIDEYTKRTIKIYPNPVASIINLERDINVDVNYSIHDILGKKCKEGIIKNTKEQLNVETLSGGIYLLKIDYQTFKIVKL